MAINIAVARLLALWSPFSSKEGPWDKSVSRSDVAAALAANRLIATPGGYDHAGRIAYLVIHTATDPIAIDVGAPSLGYEGPEWGIIDGNHRLAAAVFRGDELINADVIGEIEWIAEILELSIDTILADD